MKILKTDQVRDLDRQTTTGIGIPGTILMENAGIHVVHVMEEHFEHLKASRIAVVAGRGNNGGDGFVVARQLYMRGIIPHVFVMAKENEIKGDAHINFEILQRYREIPLVHIPDLETFNREKPPFDSFQIIVDALIGTGISKPVEGYYAEVIEAINRSPANIVSVDIPSGLFADEYIPVEHAIFADITVTFTAPKPGLLLGESYAYVGDLYTVSIGTPDALLENPSHHLNLITTEDINGFFMPRKKTTHKGNYGHVLITGGCRGKTGAVRLAGLAALRGGAGLATVALPERYADQITAGCPELMNEPLPADADGYLNGDAAEVVLTLLANRDLLVLGPGLGLNDSSSDFIGHLLSRLEVPAIIDADALTLIAEDVSILSEVKVPLVLTPHPGEMGRLMHRSAGEIQENREQAALEFVQKHKVYIVLKGFRTVFAEPGGQIWINLTGNPGMATGGSGDVLAGLLGAFCARINHQNPDAWIKACCAAVHVHGLAGDLAAETMGEEALIAGDIISHIPAAILKITESE